MRWWGSLGGGARGLAVAVVGAFRNTGVDRVSITDGCGAIAANPSLAITRALSGRRGLSETGIGPL